MNVEVRYCGEKSFSDGGSFGCWSLIKVEGLGGPRRRGTVKDRIKSATGISDEISVREAGGR